MHLYMYILIICKMKKRILDILSNVSSLCVICIYIYMYIHNIYFLAALSIIVPLIRLLSHLRQE